MFKHLYLLMFFLIFNSECMQKERHEVGGVDLDFLQGQWDQQRMSTVSRFPDYHAKFNWTDIIAKTSEDVEENKEAKKYVFGETSDVNWSQIEAAVANGDSLSQYCLSKYFYSQMSGLFNGEKDLCCSVGSMFLLIAYYKGKQDLCEETMRQFISKYGIADPTTSDGDFLEEVSKLVSAMK